MKKWSVLRLPVDASLVQPLLEILKIESSVESNTCQSMDAYEHMSGGDLAGTSGSGENRAPTRAFLPEGD